MTDGDMKPITLWMGIDFAFMGLLTLARVATLLGAALMLLIWAVTEDSAWIEASALAGIGYIASTLIFVAIARITEASTRDRYSRMDEGSKS